MPRWAKGDWNAICDRCGLKFKASRLRRTWDGLYVCPEDWEERHAMDFLKGVSERQVPVWTRPEGSDTYVLVVAHGADNPRGEGAGGANTDSTNANFQFSVTNTGNTETDTAFSRYNTTSGAFEDFTYVLASDTVARKS